MPDGSIVVVSEPAIEPVTVAEAKLHARVDIIADEDALIGLLITAARRYAESYCNRAFITQTLRLTLDGFPGCIWLPRAPIQSISSIVYIDTAGATQTVTSPAAPEYAIELAGPVGRITPGFGYVWPIAQPRIGAVQVNFIAGYGAAASAVPAGIRHWIQMRAATLYERRSEISERGEVAPLPYVDCLLDPYRVVLA